MTQVMGPATEEMQNTMLAALNAQPYVYSHPTRNCDELMKAMQDKYPGSLWACTVYKCGNHKSWASPTFVYMRADAFNWAFELYKLNKD